VRAELLAIAIIASIAAIEPAFAQSCVELGNCPTNVSILEYFITPYNEILGGWIQIVVWGTVISLIYIRTQNGILASMIGLFIASLMTGSAVYMNAMTNTPFFYGYVLIGLSFSSTVYFLIRSRGQNP